MIGKLFRGLWRFVSVLYRTIVVLSLVMVGVVVFGVLRGHEPLVVEDNVALVVAPQGQIVDHVSDDPFRTMLRNVSGDPPNKTLLRDLVTALDRAKDDARVTLAVLKLDGMWGIGSAHAAELTAAIDRFRAAGKAVHVHDGFYPQGHYRVAAHADDIAVDPMGGVWIEGFSVYQNYFVEALDKLGVKMNVFRVGEYKSAIEPFIRSDMSEAARTANREWLGDLWQDYSADVAAARGDSAVAVPGYVDSLADGMNRLSGDAAALALESGLVDRVETRQAFRMRVGEVVGMSDEHGSFRQIHHADYLGATRPALAPKRKRIALITVEGEIVDDYTEDGVANAVEIERLIDDARLDDNTRAAVLRVNSPGGSSYGSERIRRALVRLQESGKPVVVSMANLAASGGYWVAMDADRIYAHQSTITGSIGIFGLVPTLKEGFGKLGIRTDGVGTTELAGSFRLDRELGEDARTVIQREIEFGYEQFIEGVARGRDLPIDTVRQIAQGRVWSGRDAHELGLVDAFGGMQPAVDHAADLAGLSEGSYKLHPMSAPADFTSRFLSPFTGAIVRGLGLSSIAAGLAGPQTTALREPADRLMRWVRDPQGIYAHCLCEVANPSRR